MSKNDIFPPTVYQTIYKTECIKPYVGYRFIFIDDHQRKLYKNYFVLKINSGKIIKKIIAIQVTMDGTIIPNTEKEFELAKMKRYKLVYKEWFPKSVVDDIKKDYPNDVASSLFYKPSIKEGIATDEGIVVTSYDDPKFKCITKYKTDLDGKVIPEVNLLCLFRGDTASTSTINQYYIESIISPSEFVMVYVGGKFCETQFRTVKNVDGTWKCDDIQYIKTSLIFGSVCGDDYLYPQ